MWLFLPFFLLLMSVCLFVGLPQTKLGNYLETRVNDFIRRQNHPESGEVTIRMVHVSDKVVEVKPGMKSRYFQWRFSVFLKKFFFFYNFQTPLVGVKPVIIQVKHHGKLRQETIRTSFNSRSFCFLSSGSLTVERWPSPSHTD